MRMLSKVKLLANFKAMKFLYAITATIAGAMLASAAPSSRECIIKHNGNDDTQNILDAFEKCKDGGRVIFAKGKNYTLGPVITTPELSNVEIVFQGDLVYPFNMYVICTTTRAWWFIFLHIW